MKIVTLFSIASLFTSIMIHGYLITNDSSAYQFCATTPSSFIAIVWPIAQGKDSAIEKVLRKYGTVHYKKIVYFNYNQSYSLLKDAHPHITDMQAHMQMYFPSGTFEKPARIYLLTFNNLATATQCKYAVRKLFNLGYSSIHINDYHYEAIKLAEFFYKNKRSSATSVSWREFLQVYAHLCMKNGHLLQ